MRQIVNALVTTLLLSTLAACCGYVKGKPAGPPNIEPIPRSELPLEAAFVPVGWAGTAYRLEGGTAGEVRFPMTESAVEGLLPATVRLFRFDEGAKQWTEIADSRYDEASGDLVGADLDPGFYTGFGWSSNPAANALQRIALDASLGYAGLGTNPLRVGGVGQGQGPSIDAFRSTLVQGWLGYTVVYPITFCRIVHPACPLTSGCPVPGTPVGDSCFVMGVDCRACCQCITFRGRISTPVPGSFIEPPRFPCERTRLCPVCPNGLSCPTGPFVELPEIKPEVEVPDYSILEELGLGVVLDDPVLRDHLHGLVEEVTGGDYPVPASWEEEPLGPSGP